MADSTPALIDIIQDKVEKLALRLADQQSENESLKAEIQSLRLDLKDCREELAKAKTEIEYLSLSHNLASSPQALADARKLIGSLINKVDSAIDAIRKDPAF